MEKTAKEELATQLATRLKSERLRTEMNPRDFGHLGGVSERSQFNYENGERIPDAMYLARISAQAGIDVQYLLTGRRTRTTDDITPAERALLDRYSVLPPRLRDFIDQAALLAYLSQQDRKSYHEDSPQHLGLGAPTAGPLTAPPASR